MASSRGALPSERAGAHGTMLTSHASAVAPEVQRRRERGLLAAAALGEMHLHVSDLVGDLVAIGAFHRRPPSLSGFWQRHTGGRAVACGSGFLVVSVALPHRSALVANERHALKPEQVMNRCIRGVMAALRSLGVDSIYPGLDLLTCERRAVAHLSFVETQGGATLFQTILAVEQSFARTARLLDHLDPDGRVPTVMMDAAETTTLGERSPAARRVRLTAASFVEQVAAGYREAFGVEPTDLDPEVTEVLAAGYADEPDPVHLPPHPEGASTARTVGLLGPIEACVATRSGAIEAAVIYGDFLAPEHMVEELDRALRGCPLSREQIAQVVRSVLDGSNGYVLGLKPAEVALLLASACGLEP